MSKNNFVFSSNEVKMKQLAPFGPSSNWPEPTGFDHAASHYACERSKKPHDKHTRTISKSSVFRNINEPGFSCLGCDIFFIYNFFDIAVVWVNDFILLFGHLFLNYFLLIVPFACNRQCIDLKSIFTLKICKVYPSPWEPCYVLIKFVRNLYRRHTYLKEKN